MKILILGSDGMLGHILSRYLTENNSYKIYNLSRKNKSKVDNHYKCDIYNEKRFLEILHQVKPNIIINCIGVLIRDSNTSKKNAIYINAYFPNFLYEISTKFKFKIIHISTDCVFSGLTGKYTEQSIKDAKDTYGITKSIGEINSSNHLTIRCSIIGPEIKINSEGLFNWFLKQTGEISGYSRAIWSGLTTLELSKVILFAINHNIIGLWNVSSKEPISKYELLLKIKKKFSKKIKIKKDSKVTIDKSMISIRNIEYLFPNYDQMIDELFNYYTLNKKTYNYYINESNRT